MKLDLHNHTNASKDANIKPETFLKTAKKLGIGIAVTDHNTTSSWQELKKENQQYKVPLVLGEEIMTFENGKKNGEIIGLFMNKEIKPGGSLDVIDQLKSQDALITIPHPFDQFRNALKNVQEIVKKVDCLEVYNSRCYTKKANAKAWELCAKLGKGITAGSDGHTVNELGHAFVQNDDCTSLEEMRKAIQKGKVAVVGQRTGPIPHIKTQLIKANIMKDE